MAIPLDLRFQVSERALGRCEYCGLAQAGQEATFHVDHITPVVAEGSTRLDNLALACVSCSLRKGARQFFVDPKSGDSVDVFHPRKNQWEDHFSWLGSQVVGKTSIGRAAVESLKLNRELIIAIRNEEALLGRHPPSSP